MEESMITNEEKTFVKDIVYISYSRGRGKYGKRYCYIRPKNDCANRSRRVGGWDGGELWENILKCVKKWYSPIHYFQVGEYIICSNNEKNALREYWRFCERQAIGVQQTVLKLT